MIPVIILFSFYGVYIGGKFEKLYGRDPAQCTIDEVVGMWISLYFFPNLYMWYYCFLVWRAMDIINISRRKIRKSSRGWGIMMDDIAASIYSLLFVHIILLIFG